MDELNKWLDKIKETRSLKSEAALARLLKVERQTLFAWRKGGPLPDEVACDRIAQLVNEPLAKVLGKVGETRAKSTEAKAVWRKLGTAAAAILGTYWISRGGHGDAVLALLPGLAITSHNVSFGVFIALAILATLQALDEPTEA